MTAKDIFALKRINQQGKPALGFGVVLIVLFLIIGGGLYVINVLKIQPKKDPKVKAETAASQPTRRGVGSPIDQPLIYQNELPDTRQKPAKSLETLYTQSQTEKAKKEQENKPPVVPVATTNEESVLDKWIPKVHVNRLSKDHGPGTPGGELRETSIEKTHEDGHDYLFADKLVLTYTNEVQGPTGVRPGTGFKTKSFLPRGYKIPIILLSTINTSVGAMPVELAVAKDSFFNGKLQLPFGWKIYGVAGQGPNMKVTVNVDTIVDPLGKEYPISGMVINLEQEPGFTGIPLKNPFIAQAAPILQSTIGTFLNAAKDVTDQQSTMITSGGVITNNNQQFALNSKNILLDGAAKVMEGALAKKVGELTKMYPEGNAVPRGTLGYIYLLSPLDMTMGVEGGSRQFLTESSAPHPNIITLAQQQSPEANPLYQPTTPVYPQAGPAGPGNFGEITPGNLVPNASLLERVKQQAATGTKQLE